MQNENVRELVDRRDLHVEIDWPHVIDTYSDQMRNWARVRYSLNRSDADEVLQEVFVLLLTRPDKLIAQIEKGYPLGRTLCLFVSNVVRHRQQKYARSQKREKGLAGADFPMQLPEDIEAQTAVDIEADWAALQQMIPKLSLDEQAVIKVHVLQGRSLRETAEIIGISLSRVRTLVPNAIASLRQFHDED